MDWGEVLVKCIVALCFRSGYLSKIYGLVHLSKKPISTFILCHESSDYGWIFNFWTTSYNSEMTDKPNLGEGCMSG